MGKKVSSRIVQSRQKPAAFDRVSEPAVIRRTFEEAGTLNSTLTLWTPGKTWKREGVITSFDRKGSFTVRVRLGHQDLKSQEVLQKQTPFLFMFYFKPQLVIGFQTKVIEATGEEVVFEVPQEIFQVKRRASQRIQISAGYHIDVEFGIDKKNLIRMPVYDLSEGGLSFLIEPDEAQRYPVGVSVLGMRLLFRGRVIYFDGEICNQFSITANLRGPQIKVGIRFSRIDPIDQREISSFVVENLALSGAPRL